MTNLTLSNAGARVRTRKTPLQQLKSFWDLDESEGSSWFWILQSRFRNIRGNEVHADIGHIDFTKNTTRQEIVKFYERAYSGLLEVAVNQERELQEANARIQNLEAHVAHVERSRDIAYESWSKHKLRFETLMDLLTESHEPQEEPH